MKCPCIHATIFDLESGNIKNDDGSILSGWIAIGRGSGSDVPKFTMAYCIDNDLTTWNQVPNSYSILKYPLKLKFNGKIWIAGGSASNLEGNDTGGNTIVYSNDGIQWQTITNGGRDIFNSRMYDLQYNGVLWVAVGQHITNGDYSGRIANSKDGINWNISNNPINAYAWNSITWNKQYWIISGIYENIGKIYYSSDAVNWSEITTADQTNQLYGINSMASL